MTSDPATDNRAATRLLWRSIAILAAITLVTAWFSDLYYFADEHYQILEFMSRKLGITAPGDMRWEYHAHVRPWLQPFLYYWIARPMMAVGITDLFNMTFVIRLATGAASVAALALFARELLPTIEGEEEKKSFAGYLPWFGFLPYLFVRTASETLSAALFTAGLALVLRSRSISRMFWSGLLCGLAFESRYQSGVLIVGLAAWLLVLGRARLGALAAFVLAMLVAIGLGTLVDYWGYGQWVFAPWLYFKVNILDGVAASFGTDPFYAYLYMMPAQFFALITIVVMAGMMAMWLRNPRHILTWVTLPFVAVHMLIGHKEARFLFPLALICTAFPVLGFSPRLRRWRPLFTRVWEWRRGAAAKFTTAVSVAVMLLLAVYPLGFRPHMAMAKYIYRNFPAGFTAYTFDTAPYPSYPMYQPQPYHFTILRNQADLASRLKNGPVYLIDNRPTLAPGVLPPGAHATQLFTEFPFHGLVDDAWGTRYLDGFVGFSARLGFLKMPPVDWVTLYRVDPATRS